MDDDDLQHSQQPTFEDANGDDASSSSSIPVKPPTTTNGVLHVAAVATHLERYAPLLVQSCAKLGVKLNVLGWDEKLTGFAFRLQKTLDYVETLSPNDVVLFIDAFDVVLIQNAEVILKKFYASGAQMIISKDGEHPNTIINFFIKRVFRPVGNTYINIGGFIGYAGYIRDLMKALFKFGDGFSDKENDQELLARYLAENKALVNHEIIIDEHSDLFLTLYGGHPLWIGKNEYKLNEHRKQLEIEKDGSVHYLPTDSWPCVVHFPANGNADEFFEKLGYKLPTSVDKNYTQLSHTKYLLRMFRHYWKFIYAVFIKIVLMVVALVIIGYLFYRFKHSSSTGSVLTKVDEYAQRNIRLVPYAQSNNNTTDPLLSATAAAPRALFVASLLAQPITS